MTIPAFAIASGSGLTAVISAHGARLISLTIPGAGGGTDVVMGPPAPEHAVIGDRYAGAICGRYANRIASAAFAIGGVRYALAANEGRNQLHGGPDSFSDRVWSAEADGGGVVLKLVSPAGDQGFPGKLMVEARYACEDRSLVLDMRAVTDAPTVVNLTNHAYWNLAGAGGIHAHRLAIPAAHYLPVDGANIPVGGPRAVEGTAFDFRMAQSLESRLAARPQGYDHNFCLPGERGQLHPAAVLEHPPSGRSLSLATTEPGVQAYTAQHFGPGIPGKPGQVLERFGAIALEPQAWPNTPNEPAFPAAVLRPGETYRHRITWQFDWPA